MDRLLLVDGSNLLFQMFYGMPNAIADPKGRDIRGTVGFLGALRKILAQIQPTHVAVLFDGECANSRTLIDEAYKANRPDYSQMAQEETPFGQLEHIYSALDLLGICHRETEDCEADDWIAGYALTYGAGMEIVISSFDSDYFQLISDTVTVLRYRGDASMRWTVETVQEKYGIHPSQYAGFKALTGDSADHISGVDKVGPKTAAALMNQFGTLEELLAEQIKRPALREVVRRASARIRTNQALIRLENRQPLPFSIEALQYAADPFQTTQVLSQLGLR